MRYWAWLTVLLWLVALPACAQRTDSEPPRAPEIARLRTAEPYSPGDDVCRIDRAACPVVVPHAMKRRSFADNAFGSRGVSAEPSILLTGPLSGAPAARSESRVIRSGIVAEAKPEAPAAIPVSRPRPPGTEMLDIEAHVTIDVESIAAARSRVTRLVLTAGGQVVNEVVEDQSRTRGASLSIRVPSPAVQTFLSGLAALGKIRAQRVETIEVSRTVSDAEVLLKNLERALDRYQELLAKAANVTEALAIEAELQRVRTSLERVRSDLELMRDRVARSTVYVTLSLADESDDDERAAKLHPGLRGVMLFDVAPGADARSFAGAGISLAWSRAFSVDLDIGKRLDQSEQGTVDSLFVTLGSELYSDFLGRGRRHWFNPYFGFRGGYARVLGANALLLGGSLGFEIFKSSFFRAQLEGRVYAAIGPEDGVHLAIQPGVGVNVAY